jgi:hypothetical protein
LAVLEAAVTGTVLYAAALAVVCANAMAGVRETSWMFAVDCLTVAAATLGCIAFSCRIWGPQLERLFGGPSENQTARMQYRQLRTLHRLVGSCASVSMRRGLGLRRRDPTMALAYQVCAIIEGRKQLTPYRDEQVEAIGAEWGRVLAEAIRFAAAARTRRTNRRVTPTAKTPSAPLDMRAELDRDLRLAAALTMLQTLYNTGEFGRYAEPRSAPGPSPAAAALPALGVTSAG